MASDSEQLDALLQKAWQGEWYGVRVYGDLAAARLVPQQSAALLELVVLETYVLGELTVALLALGVEPDLGDIESVAEADIAAHASDDWLDLIAWIKSDAELALGHYANLAELTGEDPSLAVLAALVVDHERALIAFAQRTLSGDPNALDDVRALVRVDG